MLIDFVKFRNKIYYYYSRGLLVINFMRATRSFLDSHILLMNVDKTYSRSDF